MILRNLCLMCLCGKELLVGQSRGGAGGGAGGWGVLLLLSGLWRVLLGSLSG